MTDNVDLYYRTVRRRLGEWMANPDNITLRDLHSLKTNLHWMFAECDKGRYPIEWSGVDSWQKVEKLTAQLEVARKERDDVSIKLMEVKGSLTHETARGERLARSLTDTQTALVAAQRRADAACRESEAARRESEAALLEADQLKLAVKQDGEALKAALEELDRLKGQRRGETDEEFGIGKPPYDPIEDFSPVSLRQLVRDQRALLDQRKEQLGEARLEKAKLLQDKEEAIKKLRERLEILRGENSRLRLNGAANRRDSRRLSEIRETIKKWDSSDQE